MTNTSDFSDDLFLTKNWAGWSKLQVSKNSAAPDSGPELRLLGNQSARVFLERDGGAHQCELIMINDEALAQTKSLSTQLSLTTNQRNPGCLVIAGNTGNVVCNTSFTNLSDSRVKTEMAEADVVELQQLFDSVEAKQYKRPDMNEDLRLGFASNNFAGTKWKNLTGTARWSDGTEMVTGRPSAGRRTSRCEQASLHPGNLEQATFLGQQSCFFKMEDLADDFNVRDPRKLYRLASPTGRGTSPRRITSASSSGAHFWRRSPWAWWRASVRRRQHPDVAAPARTSVLAPWIRTIYDGSVGGANTIRNQALHGGTPLSGCLWPRGGDRQTSAWELALAGAGHQEGLAVPEWWVNKVGTYGMASAQSYWGRLAAILLRVLYALFPQVDWNFVFVDDFLWLL